MDKQLYGSNTYMAIHVIYHNDIMHGIANSSYSQILKEAIG